MENSKRPTKKQKELLDFVEKFVAQHGYGPSYREIMKGCDYASPATVAAHVKNLIDRGLLKKSGRQARSLEVVNSSQDRTAPLPTNTIKPGDEKWLIDHIEYRFSQAENGSVTDLELDSLYVLVGALKVLGLEGAAQAFMPRLSSLKRR